MPDLLASLDRFLTDGGVVMWPLLGALLALWYTVGLRVVALRRGDGRKLVQLLAAARERSLEPKGVVDGAVQAVVEASRKAPLHRRRLTEVLGPFRAELRTGRVVVQSLVVAAPLLGLLGTVSGMIETFDSLASMAMVARSGGISGGISQALLTTQFGLAVAIPGVLVGRHLQTREARLDQELDELTEMLLARRRAA